MSVTKGPDRNEKALMRFPALQRSLRTLGAGVSVLVVALAILSIPLAAAAELELSAAETTGWIMALYGLAGAVSLVMVVRYRQPLLVTAQWQPPGGVLELDEAILDGLVREVAKETGLHVEAGRLSGAYKNMPRGVVALVFRCAPASGQPTTTAESREVTWLSPVEVRTYMDEAYAIRILDALHDGPPQVRTHDGVNLL